MEQTDRSQRVEGLGLEEISQRTYLHIFLPMNTDNTVVKARGEGGG